MTKAALVVGARPQFIKTAPLILELGRFFKIVLIHTGQHYDFAMSDSFFDELSIPNPDYHLEASAASPGKQIGRMIDGLESVLSFEKPEMAIVVGDTNSTLAGAIAAAKLAIPLAHIEAGVRSKDRKLPEQINRVVTDSISDYFLCPTPSASENLHKEGKFDHVYDSGDVIYDCLRQFEPAIPDKPASISALPQEFILMTIHRAEAVDNCQNLEFLLRSIETASLPVVFPVHPRTAKRLKAFGLLDKLPSNLFVSEPLGYLDVLSLIRRSRYVITDSGGVQRESIFLGKPVILARPETEWTDLEKSGWLKVMGYRFDLSEGVNFPRDKGRDFDHLFRPASAAIAEILSGI